MPRKRRPDQGPPVPRIRNACLRCKEKRYKCSEERPCGHCTLANVPCIANTGNKRVRSEQDCCRSESSLSECVAQPSLNDTEIQELDREDGILQPKHYELQHSRELSDLRTSLHNLLSYDKQHVSSIDVLQLSPSSTTDYNNTAAGSMNTFLSTPIFLTRPSTPMSSTLLELNPLYKELWFHYTEVLSCLHSPHDITSNPIVKILSPAAQSFDPLLAVLLASSLENYRSLRGLPPDEEILGSLMSLAVAGVQKELTNTTDGNVGELTLATVIALCDFEVVARKRATTSSWRIHLNGAKRIIDLHGGPRQRQSNSDFYQFLLKWLAYFDVMSSVTSIDLDAEPLFAGKYWLRSDHDGAVLEEDFKLDPYMGFLQDVIPFFLEVGKLTRQKQKLTEALNLRNAHELHVRCRDLEYSLKNTLGTVSGQSFMSDDKAKVLINCHDAFVYAIMIHLYRRVEGLASDTADVRTCVILGLKHIALSCQAEASEIDSSLLFPLFTFGCEAFTESDRIYVMDRMTALGALGLGNVDRAIEVLIRIWQLNNDTDGSTEMSWDQILRMFNWEVNLA